ncbi:MAG: aldo/keto reductase [Anaerolineae bacterium]|nr:aldo/keto reductase [Anaerolineae bacterium]
MEYRQLGHSNLEVSAFSLGSWLTYEFMDEKEALAVIESGLQAGINFLDDARYDDRTGHAPLKSGYSEVLFGRLLRQGGWSRADLVIANKLWYEFYPAESPEAELDGSLARLQMEYLDLVYCVPPPASLPVADMVRQMDALIKTGKLRYWGVLNWSPAQIEAAYQVAREEGLAAPVAAQLAYSLLQTLPVEDAAARAVFQSAGIGVVASYALYGGLLSGKYNRAGGEYGRFRPDAVESMRQKQLLAKVDALIALAAEVGCTPVQLALAYCLANEQVVSLLFGATKVAQVAENVQALAVLSRLDAKMMGKLQAISQPQVER